MSSADFLTGIAAILATMAKKAAALIYISFQPLLVVITQGNKCPEELCCFL